MADTERKNKRTGNKTMGGAAARKMILALPRRRTLLFSSWSLGIAIAIQLLGCSAANDIDRSPEIFVAGGYLVPEAIAAAKDRDDVYVYAGEAVYGESAVAVRLSDTKSAAEVLWRYDRDPRSARIKNGVYFGDGSRPIFRGVVTMPDGSTFLCGDGPADRGEERPGLLLHLDASGQVIHQDELLSSNADLPTDDQSSETSSPTRRLNRIETCLTWGDHTGVVGRVIAYPREGKHRVYYWIVDVDSAGKILRQKLIPTASPAEFETAQFTSAQVTPRQNLLIARHKFDTTELVSINPAGQLIASRHLDGYFVAVSSVANQAIEVFGGDPKKTQSLIKLDEELHDVGREDNLAVTRFLAAKAYGLSDNSLVLFGSEIQDNNFLSQIRRVTAKRSIESMTLIHGDLFDEGAARVSTRTPTAGKFILVRHLLKRKSVGAESLGIALTLIRTESK